MTNVHLKRIDSCQVAGEWGHIEYLLNCAVECWNDHYSLENIRQLLLSGHMQFWHLRREDEELPYLGGMTQIDVYGLKKVLRVWWLGGKSFDDTLNFLWTMELWAKKMGCSEIEVVGRDAFERVLRDVGFQKTHVVLRKKLNHVSDEEH